MLWNSRVRSVDTDLCKNTSVKRHLLLLLISPLLVLSATPQTTSSRSTRSQSTRIKPESETDYETFHGRPVYSVGPDVSEPRPVKVTSPPYQESLRKFGVEGVVILQVIVGHDGHIYRPSVVQSLNADLDKIALQTVKGWQYYPAIKDSHPVDVQMSLDVMFRHGHR